MSFSASANFFGKNKQKYHMSPFEGYQFREDPIEASNRVNIFVPVIQNPFGINIPMEDIEFDERKRHSIQPISKVKARLRNDIQNAETLRVQQPMEKTIEKPIVQELRETQVSTNPKIVITNDQQERISIERKEVMASDEHISFKEMLQGLHTSKCRSMVPKEQDIKTKSVTFRDSIHPIEKKTGGRRKILKPLSYHQHPMKKDNDPESRNFSNKLRRMLYYDDRLEDTPQAVMKNGLVEEIIKGADSLRKDDRLLQSVHHLKRLHLLNLPSPKVSKATSLGKIDYVFNDFHARNTNPGFSRKNDGTFYGR